MAPGPIQILIILVIALLVFGGRGKISSIMGDFAKGITAFRKGLKEDDEDSDDESSSGGQIGQDGTSSSTSSESEKTSS